MQVNKWVVVSAPATGPAITLDIKFKFINPYVITAEENFTFTKPLNSRPLLVSLVPSYSAENNSRHKIKIQEYET